MVFDNAIALPLLRLSLLMGADVLMGAHLLIDLQRLVTATVLIGP